MINVSAVETATTYVFMATDGTKENTYVYEWGKEVPEGQTKEEYLANCKREAELLAQHEINKKAEPTPITI